MTMERKRTGARMSQIVIRGDTVYLAGQASGHSQITKIRPSDAS